MASNNEVISYNIDVSKAQKSLDALQGSLIGVKKAQNDLNTAFQNGEVDAETFAKKTEILKKA